MALSFPSTPREAVGHSPSLSSGAVQFVHITGEMTNPAHLENFIIEHPMVHSAIMFGHGRYNAGVLIELEAGSQIDINNAKEVEEARNKLQPVIERMNMFAPQHSRLSKEMILFAAPTKPFIYSSQGAVRVDRQDTLDIYNNEINALYTTVERATEAHMTLRPPKIWSPKNSLTYVRGIVAALWGKRIDDNADLCNYGVDSLQAARIRIVLFQALQSTANVDTRKFSGTVLYQYNTIASLAAFATRAARACFLNRTESSLARCFEMKKMVESHYLAFPKHQPSMPPPHDDVILITSTTGLFGSNLLAQFLQSPRVLRVYALNRKKRRCGSLVERHATLLQASGLNPDLAHHHKLTLLQADATRKYIGLHEEIYEELLSSVTHIVHNAWLSRHDDDVPLNIFDGSIGILRNLVDFALSSPHHVPPRLLFISSMDTLGSASAAYPEGPVNVYDAVGCAYGESKWIGEQILAAAASKTSLRPIIFRVDRMCGAANGRWREGEHFPMIVQQGIQLGVLPKVDEAVSWIPVHTAAQGVAEMRDSCSTYLHVTHPVPVSSLSLLRCIAKELNLPFIPLSQWTAKLEERVYAKPHSSSSKLDPALILLRHIKQAKDHTTAGAPTRILGHSRMSADDASFASAGGVRPLGMADVRLWLRHWREVGMIPNA